MMILLEPFLDTQSIVFVICTDLQSPSAHEVKKQDMIQLFENANILALKHCFEIGSHRCTNTYHGIPYVLKLS